MTGGKINRNTQEEIKRIQKKHNTKIQIVSQQHVIHSLIEYNTEHRHDSLNSSSSSSSSLMNQMIRHRVAL